MNKNTKMYSVLSYITWIGWLIAYFKREKNDAMVKHHLNQAFALNIAEVIVNVISRRTDGLLFSIAGLASMVLLVLSIMGIYRAIKLSDEPLPIIGDIKVIE